MGNDVHSTKQTAAGESLGHLSCHWLRGVEDDRLDFGAQPRQETRDVVDRWIDEQYFR